MKDGVLSFIPPDGKFRLMEYECASDNARISVPIQLKTGLTIEDYGGKQGGWSSVAWNWLLFVKDASHSLYHLALTLDLWKI